MSCYRIRRGQPQPMKADNQQPVVIYISAAGDLLPERETLARMIAALPVTLTWHVVQTPLGEDTFDPGLVAAADLHVLIIGGDIRAPVGLELYASREAGRPLLAYLKRGVARTTAGDIFAKSAGVSWRTFVDPTELGHDVRRALIEHLLHHALLYALSPAEIEQLEGLIAANPAAAAPDDGRTEAGRSALIMSRERFTPSEGVLVDEAPADER